jgi:succinoglycan biosynthesis transport protein ExoP
MTNDVMQRYLRILKRWWWLAIISLVLPMGVTYYLLSGEAPLYQSTVTLMVGTTLQSSNPDASTASMSNYLATAYAQLVTRPTVTEAVIERLGLQTTPDGLVSQISTRVQTQAQLLEITVTDQSPTAAAEIANALADELVSRTPGTKLDAGTREFSEAQLADLESKINDVNKDLATQYDELAGLTSAAEISDAEDRISALQRVLTTYQSSYASLLQAMMSDQSPNTLTIMEPASVPTEPIAQRRKLAVLLAGAAGLALAVVAVLIIEYFDDRLHWEGWGQDPILGLPVFGAIPQLPHSGPNNGLIMWSEPDSVPAEAIRALRTSIHLSMDSQPTAAIMLASPNPQDGKSLVIANLAVAMATQGQRVALIDADLRVPQLHRYFGLENEQGLSELLADSHANPSDYACATYVPNLTLFRAGTPLLDPTFLLSSSRFRDVVNQIKSEYDLVLFDGPAVLAVPDTLLLAGMVDSILLLIDARTTSQRVLLRAKNLLTEQGKGEVIGTVFNRARLAPTSYYYRKIRRA